MLILGTIESHSNDSFQLTKIKKCLLERNVHTLDIKLIFSRCYSLILERVILNVFEDPPTDS